MQSVLSLLTGAVLIGLVYGLSFLPTATLARYDDDSAMADEAPSDAKQDTETGEIH